MSSQKQVKVTLPNGFKADNVRVENGLLTYDLVEEEKFEPKDGDFVCTISVPNGERRPFIFKSDNGNGKYNYHAGIDGGGYLTTPKSDLEHYSNINGGYATEEEKQLLLDRLDEEGYEWNAENKEVVRKLWRAEYGKEYWYINNDYTFNLNDYRDFADNSSYDCGNYFRTKEEAEAFLPKVIELFKQRRKL